MLDDREYDTLISWSACGMYACYSQCYCSTNEEFIDIMSRASESQRRAVWTTIYTQASALDNADCLPAGCAAMVPVPPNGNTPAPPGVPDPYPQPTPTPTPTPTPIPGNLTGCVAKLSEVLCTDGMQSKVTAAKWLLKALDMVVGDDGVLPITSGFIKAATYVFDAFESFCADPEGHPLNSVIGKVCEYWAVVVGGVTALNSNAVTAPLGALITSLMNTTQLGPAMDACCQRSNVAITPALGQTINALLPLHQQQAQAAMLSARRAAAVRQNALQRQTYPRLLGGGRRY